MIELIILVLSVQWLLSFLGMSIFPGIPHSGIFTYLLSIAILALIITRSFLSL